MKSMETYLALPQDRTGTIRVIIKTWLVVFKNSFLELDWPRPKADDRIRPCTFTYDEKRQSYISVVNYHRARRDTNDYVCRIRRYQRRSCTASVHGRIRSCCYPCTISYDTAYCGSPRTAKKISSEICLIIHCIVCILSLSYPYDCSPISCAC